MIRKLEQLDFITAGLLLPAQTERFAGVADYERQCSRLGIRPDAGSDLNFAARLAVWERYHRLR